MNLKSLKRKFLATLPVIGPHANIEAEMMLAGKKPITWMHAMKENEHTEDIRLKIEQRGRKLLDKAVESGQLIAIDVKQLNPNHPNGGMVFRHYAQPDNEEKLKLIAAYNTAAFNGKEPSQELEKALDKDFGHYLGYRKRDILFFNNIINSRHVPNVIKDKILDLNVRSQKAYRDTQLEKAGYDVKEWYEDIKRLDI